MFIICIHHILSGTLTENRMTVVEGWFGNITIGEDVYEDGEYGYRYVYIYVFKRTYTYIQQNINYLHSLYATVSKCINRYVHIHIDVFVYNTNI
jgi:magnesium-transporting ATPase (P-type)